MLNRKEKITKTAAIILSIIIASSAISLGDESSIGKNTSQIVFDDKDSASKTFKIWNKGTGTLNYKVSVSTGSTYFKVTPTTGTSGGSLQERTHTVTVDFNTVPHAATVTGKIKITNNSDVNSPQYIDLTAHDAISRHIQFISIEQGIDYIPGADDENASVGNCDGMGLAGDLSCDGYVDFLDFAFLAEQWRQTGSNLRADISPASKNGSVDMNDLSAFINNWLADGRIGQTYDFRLIVETDSTVADINFITPDGFIYPDSNLGSSRHFAKNRSTENGITYWQYQEWFYEANGLDNYLDGKYTIKAIYKDHNSDQTEVYFGIPKQAGSIARITQRPEFISPLNSDWIVSPLTFSWDKCTDVNVNSIRLGYRNSHDSNTTDKDFDKKAVKADSLKLVPGSSFADLSFGQWYLTTNSDGIAIEAGKTSRNHIAFDVTKGFGTFGGEKNHQLQVADCNGKMVTFTLTGGGWGSVEGDPNIQDDCSFAKIILTGTTDKSVLTITPLKGAKAIIGSIESDGPVKTINAPSVNVTGDISINGTAANITLNDISGSSNITIGSAASSKATASLKLGRINKLALTSRTPIATLKATEWKTGSLTTPWVSSLSIDGNSAGGIAGNFGADVNLSGQGNPKGTTLKKATIAGEIGDSNWTITGSVGTITAAGSSKGLDVNITSSIGTLKALGNKPMNLKATLSGIWNAESANTITAGQLEDFDLTTENGLTKTLNVKGIVEEPFGLINSNIYAGSIGTAYLAFPKYSNGGTPFGLTAVTINKVTVKDPTKTTTLKGSQLGTEGFTTEDFEIRLK
jgi:hypothetical protein